MEKLNKFVVILIASGPVISVFGVKAKTFDWQAANGIKNKLN